VAAATSGTSAVKVIDVNMLTLPEFCPGLSKAARQRRRRRQGPGMARNSECLAPGNRVVTGTSAEAATAAKAGEPIVDCDVADLAPAV
jgi:hypothetical protein